MLLCHTVPNDFLKSMAAIQMFWCHPTPFCLSWRNVKKWPMSSQLIDTRPTWSGIRLKMSWMKSSCEMRIEQMGLKLDGDERSHLLFMRL